MKKRTTLQYCLFTLFIGIVLFLEALFLRALLNGFAEVIRLLKSLNKLSYGGEISTPKLRSGKTEEGAKG